MYDEMWEDHTEDIFGEISEKQALNTPSPSRWGEMGFLTKLWASAKMFEQSAFFNTMKKFPKHKKGSTIKFRRYITDVNSEETVVGGIICEATTTLGDHRSVMRTGTRSFSDYGDSIKDDFQEVVGETKEP